MCTKLRSSGILSKCGKEFVKTVSGKQFLGKS